MISSESRMDFGMFFRGFRTSSPVVAMQSNPTKPKKQVAAPRRVPSNPKGKKPPAPMVEFALTVLGSTVQLEKSAGKGNTTIN